MCGFPYLENPYLENPYLENPYLENPYLENLSAVNPPAAPRQGEAKSHSRPDPFVSRSKPVRRSRQVGFRSRPAPWGGWGGLVDLYFVFLSLVYLSFVYLYLVVCGFPYLENPYLENPYLENPYPENPYLENPYPENPYLENPYLENPSAVNPLTAPRPLTGCLFAAGGGRGGFWREFAPICPQIAQRRL